MTSRLARPNRRPRQLPGCRWQRLRHPAFPGRLLRKFALLLSLAAAAAPLAAQETTGGIRVAVIKVEAVVAASREGKELAAFLQQVEKETREALEANSTRQQTLRQSAADKGPDELRSIQHEIEDLRREAQRLANDAQRRAAKREEEVLWQINERLHPIVRQLIDEGGYDLILNATVGGVLHASERTDLTQRVITLLKAQDAGNP